MTLPRLLLDDLVTVSLDRPEVILPQLLQCNGAAKAVLINQENGVMNSPAEVHEFNFIEPIELIKKISGLPVSWSDFGAGGNALWDAAWETQRDAAKMLDFFCMTAYQSRDVTANRKGIQANLTSVKRLRSSIRAASTKPIYMHLCDHYLDNAPVHITQQIAHVRWCVSIGAQGFTRYRDLWNTWHSGIVGAQDSIMRWMPRNADNQQDLHVRAWIELQEDQLAAVIRANAKGWLN